MKNNEEFRINEYSDHFTISKKFIEEKHKKVFHYIFGTTKKEEVWRNINKNGQTVNVYNYKTPTEFKTKEECLKWIENHKKYPIYHYL